MQVFCAPVDFRDRANSDENPFQRAIRRRKRIHGLVLLVTVDSASELFNQAALEELPTRPRL